MSVNWDEFEAVAPAPAPQTQQHGAVNWSNFEPVAKRQVGASEAFARGGQGVIPDLNRTGLFLLGLPGAALVDAFGGGHENVDEVARYLEDQHRQAEQTALQPEEAESIPAKIAHATPKLATDLATFILTAGTGTEAKVALEATIPQILKQTLAHGVEAGVKGAVIPGATRLTERAQEVVDRGGTGAEAFNAGVGGLESTMAANALPAGAPGNLVTRALAGAAASVPGADAQRLIENATAPADMQAPEPELADRIVQALMGAGISVGAGPRAEPSGPRRLPEPADLPPELPPAVADLLPPVPPPQRRTSLVLEPERQLELEDKLKSGNPKAREFAEMILAGRPPLAPEVRASLEAARDWQNQPEPARPDTPRAPEPAPAPAPAVVAREPVPAPEPLERVREAPPPPMTRGPTMEEREPDPAPPTEPKPAKRPPTLLHDVSKVGLNREAFRQAGVNPDYFGHRAGFHYVFRKEGGMTPDQLREHMQERGYLPPDAPDAPPQHEVNDAIDLLQTALDGKPVYSYENQQRAAELDAADRAEADRAGQDIEREIGRLDAGEHDRAANMAAWMAEAENRGIDATPLDHETDDAYITRLADEIHAKENPDDAGAAPPVAPGREAPPPEPAVEAARVPERAPEAAPAPAFAPGEVGRDPSPIESTSPKEEFRERDRAARGEEPIGPSTPVPNDEAIARARDTLREDPDAGRRTVDKLKDAGVQGITRHDGAVIAAHLRDVTNRRNAAAARASDPAASPQSRASAQREWNALEAERNEIDQATAAAGSEWGGFGQLWQQQLRADYTFEGLERRERATRGRPLTAEESATIKKQAEAIENLNRQLDEANAALDRASSDATYRAMVADMAGASPRQAAPKNRPLLDRLKKGADEARAALAAMDVNPSGSKGPRGQRGAAIVGTPAFVHLVKIGVYHVARGAYKLADFIAAMKADLGERFRKYEPNMAELHEAALKAHKQEASHRTPEEVIAKIDPAKLTSGDIAKLARAHILAGVQGEGPVMAAVTADLKKLPGLEGITERQVRQKFSDYGKATFPSKAADRVELRKIRALVQLQESIDRLNEGLPALKSGRQRDKQVAEVREKRRQLNDLLKAAERDGRASPEKLASYQDARRTNLRNQIEDLQKQIAAGEKTKRAPTPEPTEDVKALIAERDKLRDELDRITKGPELSPEQKKEATVTRSLQKRLDLIRARIAANDYARAAPRPPRELSEANRRLAYELDEAKHKFAVRQYEIEHSQRTPLGKAFHAGRSGLNLARAIMTSLDMSAVLRQGGFIALGHPVRALKAFPAMIKSFASAQAAHAVMEDIKTRPNALNYKRDKLFIAETDGQGVNAAEEAFIGRLLNRMEVKGGKIERAARIAGNLALAPIRGSGRSYVTFLNKLRADSYDAMAATLGRNKVLSPEEGAAIASYINVATGRGRIGTKGEAVAPVLNEIFFAPRLVASRFNLLGLQPLYKGNARTRKLIAAEYARFLMGVGTVMGLGALAHDPEDDKKPFINFDPRSADFGKMRFGDTYVDPLTGLAQATTLLSRVGSGEKMTGAGKLVALRDVNRLSDLTGNKLPKRTGFSDDTGTVVGRFLRTKFAPVPSFIWNSIEGKNAIGQETDVVQEGKNLITPMSLRNIADVMRENGVPAGTAIELLEMLGMSVQYRDPTTYKKEKQP